MARKNRIFSNPPNPPMPATRVIRFMKEGHRYTFRFEPGAEMSLICALLAAAINPHLNLDLQDARQLLDRHGIASVS